MSSPRTRCRSAGADGSVAGNTISDHHYTPGTYASTSVLLLQADPNVTVTDNDLAAPT